MKVLVTGASGFIGAHFCRALLAQGVEVVAIDNFNEYYDIALKHARVDWLKAHVPNFEVKRVDICDSAALMQLVASSQPTQVVHLAAQAGVRFSLEAPDQYVTANLQGFGNVLEACRHNGVEHLIYASSSSVYGDSTDGARSLAEPADRPVSLYAATKRANELMAHTYSHLYGLQTTGLRFFTVYGPFGRPDMAPWLFSDAIMNDRPIKVFNHGDMQRDFTYIGDIVDGMMRIVRSAPTDTYRLYNLGNGHPARLMDFIASLEQLLDKQAVKEFLPLQPGDVQSTHADMSAFQEIYGAWQPKTLAQGLADWAEWFLAYR